MDFPLNTKQSEKLADFFFDIAKGLILGGIGFTVIAHQEMKLIYTVVSVFCAFWCITTAMNLLEGKHESK